MGTVELTSPVTLLSGVGPVKAAAYERLGIFTLGDLLQHYPRAYENRGDVRLLCHAPTEGKCALILTVASEGRVVRLRSRKSFLKFRAFDDSGMCEMVFFNQDYLKSQFPVGSMFRFWGHVEKKGKNYTMSSPAFEPWTPHAALPPYTPVYPLTDGLSQKQIAKDIQAALLLLATACPDPIPAPIRARRGLCTKGFAMEHIHTPGDRDSLLAARRRLVFEEFFFFSLGATLSRSGMRRHTAPVCKKSDPDLLYSRLPFALTGAQIRAIEEIRRDMAGETPMSRILVGDVGCGKTVCAAAAMLFALQNGRQAALMAPTEILARQHYADLAPLFASMGYRCELLIGATSAAEKRRIREGLSHPDPQRRIGLVIGTHALLSNGVEFACPGLVVTDEQHRFGARQRAALSEKNAHSHLLVMSATPIPRTLSLVLWGDLSISKIDEMPPGRRRVDTYVVGESYRTRLHAFMEKQVAEGGQVYVVCPAIEEEEKEGGEWDLYDILEDAPAPIEEKPPLKTAVGYAKELQAALPRCRVSFLHGKMKSGEKDAVMAAFAAGEIDILVSTTVIEVGVNVPNASLMIVENAERFGLSQLHQLRGRVGRGSRRSYCVLVSDAKAPATRARLEVMHTTYDGYAIAEQDLVARGPGDFLASHKEGNVRQSGGLSFRLANAAEDTALLTRAAEDARELLREDPHLLSHPHLSRALSTAFAIEDGMIS